MAKLCNRRLGELIVDGTDEVWRLFASDVTKTHKRCTFKWNLALAEKFSTFGGPYEWISALWNWFETVTCLFRGRSSLTRAQNSKSRVKIALPRELWPFGSKFWLSKPNFWQQPAVYGSVKAWKGLKAAKTIEIQVKIPLKSKFRLFGSKFWQLRLPGANFLTLVGPCEDKTGRRAWKFS